MNYEKIKKEIEETKGTPYEYIGMCVNKSVEIHRNIRSKVINSERIEKNIKKIDELPIPEKGRNMLEVIDEMRECFCAHTLYLQHPRFYAYAFNAVVPYATIGQVMQAIYNLNGGTYSWAPDGYLLEQKIIKWLASYAGFDTEKCGGCFTSGGSMSNITGVAAGRDAILNQDEWGKGVVYISKQAHSSNFKAIHMAGFRDDQIVHVPYDEDFKMIPSELEKLIKRDIEAGKKPAMVVASIGSTNTGEVDPLYEIGTITNKYKMWLHVDGALGASLLLSKKHKDLAKGVELADSLSWDQHKWLMQSYGCSAIIVKNKLDLLKCFTTHHEYLDDVHRPEMLDPTDIGPELSRPHRVLEFWATLQAMGTDELVKFIDNSFDYAEYTYDVVSKWKDVEVVSKPSCGVINFRFLKDNLSLEELNEMNGNISKAIIDDGACYVVTTILNDKKVLRMIYMNGMTEMDDVKMSLESIRKCADKVLASYK